MRLSISRTMAITVALAGVLTPALLCPTGASAAAVPAVMSAAFL